MTLLPGDPRAFVNSRRITAIRALTGGKAAFARGVIGPSCKCPSEDCDPCEACVQVAQTGRMPDKRQRKQETEMSRASFEVYEDKRGEFRWRVTARNGETIGASSEGYVNHADCWRNATLLAAAITAAVVDQTNGG